MTRSTTPPVHTAVRVIRSTPEDMLERIGLGDLFAFSDLFDLFELRVTAMVRSVLVDPVLSAEVVLTAHLEIWQTSPRYDPDVCHAACWVLTVARCCALDALRPPAVRDRGGVAVRGTISPAVAAAWESVDVRLGRPTSMPGLSAAERERLVAAYSDAYSSAEIALELARPHVSLVGRLRAALERSPRPSGR